MYINSVFCSLHTCENKYLIMITIGVRGGCRGGRLPPPPSWKISEQTLFSGQAQVAQKYWMVKNISIQWTISGQLWFSGQAQVARKHWMIKNIYSIQLIQGTLCFSGQAQVAQKCWMMKTISIQWEISGQLCFSSQLQVVQKSWMIKNLYSIHLIQGTVWFSGQAQVAQKSWMIKNIFNTVENFTANSVFQDNVIKILIQYIQPAKAITVKFLVRENTPRKELHRLELTSKVTTGFAYDGTSSDTSKLNQN